MDSSTPNRALENVTSTFLLSSRCSTNFAFAATYITLTTLSTFIDHLKWLCVNEIHSKIHGISRTALLKVSYFKSRTPWSDFHHIQIFCQKINANLLKILGYRDPRCKHENPRSTKKVKKRQKKSWKCWKIIWKLIRNNWKWWKMISYDEISWLTGVK